MDYDGWLDSQHFYFQERGYAGGTGDVYVLDLAKGTNQTLNDLTRIHSNGYRTTLAVSYDRSQVYATYNSCDQVGCKPPSSIMALPALSGTAHTLWQSTKYAATITCPITAQQMLVVIQNANYDTDTSHNGVWLMNNNGSGMKLMTSIPNNLDDCSYPWNIVSRDGSMYTIRSGFNLAFGKLDGSGSSVTFATGVVTAQAGVVGWTLL